MIRFRWSTPWLISRRPDMIHPSMPTDIHGKKKSSRRFFGSASNRLEITRYRIVRAPGTKIGRETMADSIIPTGRIERGTFRRTLPRNRIRFIARCHTMTKLQPVIDRKRPASCPGLNKHIKARRSARARAVSSEQRRACGPSTATTTHLC